MNNQNLNSIENFATPERLQKLQQACGAGPVLILTHDNPDPDALAAGKALATLLEDAWNIPTRSLPIFCRFPFQSPLRERLTVLSTAIAVLLPRCYQNSPRFPDSFRPPRPGEKPKND